ncbi:MAG TPA: hypothetical protein VFX59_10840 [Polyangiales bacterium]|nr:hypothetical protein [Polyangiales bacterium]
MPKTPNTPRLANLDPHTVALAATRQILDLLSADASGFLGSHWRVHLEVGELDDGALRRTSAYKALVVVGRYARGPGTLHEPLTATLERIRPMLARLLDLRAGTVDELIEQAERIAHSSELALVLGAAAARERLDHNQPLSSALVAILAGRSRVHINNLIQEGALKAKLLERGGSAGRRKETYQITAAETRRFLREHGSSG